MTNSINFLICISNVIDEKEYQVKKEKFLLRKYEIKSKLANLTREATGWLEPMRDVIQTCNSVGKIIREDKVISETYGYIKVK